MKTPDYGLDAPGLIVTFFCVGAAALIGVARLAVTGWLWLSAAVAIVALYGLGMAMLMLVWSKAIKRRERDHVLDLLSWRGDEEVLDIGCGRGLMMIGAAMRLVPGRGRATGIDIWRAEDQAGNGPEAALENAVRAGVSERVTVQTADMRTLPFADASFDVVLSHWAVHNLATAADRDIALAEMVRVLGLAGTIVIADIAHRADYAVRLEALGFGDQRHIAPGWRDAVLGAVSFGSFRPGWLIARRGM